MSYVVQLMYNPPVLSGFYFRTEAEAEAYMNKIFESVRLHNAKVVVTNKPVNAIWFAGRVHVVDPKGVS